MPSVSEVYFPTSLAHLKCPAILFQCNPPNTSSGKTTTGGAVIWTVTQSTRSMESRSKNCRSNCGNYTKSSLVKNANENQTNHTRKANLPDTTCMDSPLPCIPPPRPDRCRVPRSIEEHAWNNSCLR